MTEPLKYISCSEGKQSHFLAEFESKTSVWQLPFKSRSDLAFHENASSLKHPEKGRGMWCNPQLEGLKEQLQSKPGLGSYRLARQRDEGD